MNAFLALNHQNILNQKGTLKKDYNKATSLDYELYKKLKIPVKLALGRIS